MSRHVTSVTEQCQIVVIQRYQRIGYVLRRQRFDVMDLRGWCDHTTSETVLTQTTLQLPVCVSCRSPRRRIIECPGEFLCHSPLYQKDGNTLLAVSLGYWLGCFGGNYRKEISILSDTINIALFSFPDSPILIIYASIPPAHIDRHLLHEDGPQSGHRLRVGVVRHRERV